MFRLSFREVYIRPLGTFTQKHHLSSAALLHRYHRHLLHRWRQPRIPYRSVAVECIVVVERLIG